MESIRETETIRGSEQDYRERRELFNKLILPHLNGVYRLCINYTMKPEFVEENYLEALNNLFLYIKTFNPEQSLKTWIHIVTKRHIVQIDKARRCTVVSGRGDKSHIIQVDIEMIDEERSIDDKSWREVSGYKSMHGEDVLDQHIGDDLRYALSKIPPLSRRLLLMQYDGLSNRDIAKILFSEKEIDKPDPKLVKSRMNAARQQIKKHIDRYGQRVV
ncbi:MAG: RNA polymerase sigma factor [Bacteroidales bacterium]